MNEKAIQTFFKEADKIFKWSDKNPESDGRALVKVENLINEFRNKTKEAKTK